MEQGDAVTYIGTKENLLFCSMPDEVEDIIISNPEGSVVRNLGSVIVVDFDVGGDWAVEATYLQAK